MRVDRSGSSNPFKNEKAAGYDSLSGRRRMSRKKTILLYACLLLSIGLVLTGIAFAIRQMRSSDVSFNGTVAFPGEAADTMDTSAKEDSDNMKIGLSSKLMVDGLLAKFCTIPGGTVKKSLEVSDDFLFSDQIEMMSFFAEQGDRRSFRDFYRIVGSRFQGPDGLYVRQIGDGSGISADATAGEADSGTVSGADSSSASYQKTKVSVNSNIRFCRVLLEGYSRFGNKEYLESAAALSELLYPLCSQYGIPPAEMTILFSAGTPTPDFSATPTPKPTAGSSIQPGDATSAEAVDLSAIDLYALQLLGMLDTKWNAVYDASLKAVKGALIGSPAPLFQAAYYPDTQGYAPYLGISPEFDFDRQIMTALHLAEVGELGAGTYAFLKQELMNRRAFYRSYNILTAAPASSVESVTGYACMARIARISNDPAVYDFCTGRIYWNSADSYTSKIFGLTFFEADDRTIWSYAKETILSLKALY
ncbi:MAG: hypothetical protein ACYC5K_09110 [Saccharofermentanales bacterium]